MKLILALVAALISLPATSADYSEQKELYMANQAGGDVVLTLEPCAIEEARKLGFENRTYATVAGGKIQEEGCWISPSINGAPNVPGMTIIPLVNVWYSGIILPFEQNLFTPQSNTVAVKGNI